MLDEKPFLKLAEAYLVYKRLEPEAFALLNVLGQGVSIEVACTRALRRASSQVDWQEKVKGWFQLAKPLGVKSAESLHACTWSRRNST